MIVEICNDFHNTVARVRYPGGVYPVPSAALNKLCPQKDCICLLPPGALSARPEDRVIVRYSGLWLIAPAEE